MTLKHAVLVATLWVCAAAGAAMAQGMSGGMGGGATSPAPATGGAPSAGPPPAGAISQGYITSTPTESIGAAGASRRLSTPLAPDGGAATELDRCSVCRTACRTESCFEKCWRRNCRQ